MNHYSTQPTNNPLKLGTMKNMIKLSIIPVLAILLMTGTSFAQERGNNEARVSPNATVSQNIGTTVVTVTYGRPGIKGRTYFAEGSTLAPAGEVWRTGANESTTITFSGDVIFGGEAVEAGTYTLFSIPNDNEWTVILNSNLTREDGTPAWGAYGYDQSDDVIRVTAEPAEGSDLEWFEIYFNELSDTKAHLNLHWGTVRVPVPIETE
jgi:hypothetical protein